MNIQIIRSNRKTLSLEITKTAEVLVRAPIRMPEAEIRRLVNEKSAWIESHRQKMELKNKAAEEREHLSREQIQKLADQAKVTIPGRVAAYAKQIGVTYGRITIRNQKTRWGSCSAKGNLNFNCLLMLTPSEVQDYVVVHELCHRREMNHSDRFWKEVGKILPDYKERRQWLKKHGGALIDQMM